MAPGWCEVRKRLGFTGCSQLASTRAALSSPPPAAFRPAVTRTAILAGAPSPGPTSFPLPCRRVLSRSQRLAACRARYLWGTSTGGGLWYSGPWPVFPAFPGVREVINFADVQAPVCYSNFFSVAKSCMKSRHREGLRHLLNFKLKKHPRYNLSSKRLKYIEIAVQKRASLLLEGETHSESELSFW